MARIQIVNGGALEDGGARDLAPPGEDSMRDLGVSGSPATGEDSARVYGLGLKIFSIKDGKIRADSASPELERAEIDPAELVSFFVQMLKPRTIARGFVGRRVQLDGLPPLTLDWLTIGRSDCFATFDWGGPGATDFVLLLTRLEPNRDDANLQWFIDKVLGSHGSHVNGDSLRHVREWPAPLALSFPATPRPSYHRLIDLTERCFCHAFLRVVSGL